MIGRRIGNYEVVCRLGEGGVGQVFAGIDLMLDRPVAIKALRPEHSRDPGFIGRFRAEASALARLDHPNIARIYSLEQQGAEHFMILELVQGVTLEAILGEVGRLPEEAALALAAQAIAGLAAAHGAGIVHRDLKPANLMVTPAGVAQLMDFGIARVRGTDRLTRTGHMVGTLAYMAPEQVRGEEGDARSDLYSLGLMLYETVSGRYPFSARTDYELIRAQLEQPAPSLLNDRDGTTSRFNAAIMRCLEKDPARRPQDVLAFGQALGAVDLGGLPAEILRRWTGAAVSRAVKPVSDVITRARSRHGAPPVQTAATPVPPTRVAPLPTSLARKAATPPARPARALPFRPLAAGLLGALGLVAIVLAFIVLMPASGLVERRPKHPASAPATMTGTADPAHDEPAKVVDTIEAPRPAEEGTVEPGPVEETAPPPTPAEPPASAPSIALPEQPPEQRRPVQESPSAPEATPVDIVRPAPPASRFPSLETEVPADPPEAASLPPGTPRPAPVPVTKPSPPPAAVARAPDGSAREAAPRELPVVQQDDAASRPGPAPSAGPGWQLTD